MEQSIKYSGWVNEPGDLVERLIIGDEMPQSKRKTFSIDPIFTGNRSNQITGTIGYLDFRTVATHETVETEEDRIIRLPSFLGFNLKLYPPKKVIVPRTHTAIELAVLGIEPEYQRRGYAMHLLKELENVAKDRRIGLLVSAGPFSDNKASLEFHKRVGFIKADRFFRTGKTGMYDCYPYYKTL